jgi:hypothetical protein
LKRLWRGVGQLSNVDHFDNHQLLGGQPLGT